MKFPLILFDADDTLFDFGRSEKHSFHEVLALHGIAAEEPHYKSYKEISFSYWKKFEEGKISKEELRVGRYETFVEKHGFSADPMSLSQGYLDILKHQTFLIDGALELVRSLFKKTKIGIVTNGIEEVQKHRFAKSQLAPFIHFVVVSEECGFAKPHRGIFEYAMRKSSHGDVSTVLMVGDRADTDIIGAQAMGMKTCWYNPGQKSHNFQRQPDFEVRSLSMILDITN